MRIHRITPHRVTLVERHPSSVTLQWVLLAGAPVGVSIAYKHHSWPGIAFAVVCLLSVGLLWRWGARRVVRAARDGTIRLRDPDGVRWEFAVDRIEELEVCGDPEARGGHDYQVIMLVRQRGWVSLCPGSGLARAEALAAANAIRSLLGWAPIKQSGAEDSTSTAPPARLAG